MEFQVIFEKGSRPTWSTGHTELGQETKFSVKATNAEHEQVVASMSEMFNKRASRDYRMARSYLNSVHAYLSQFLVENLDKTYEFLVNKY